MINCTIPGCTDSAVAMGLCAKHYMRLRRTGDAATVNPPGRRPKPGGKTDKFWVEARRLFDENCQLSAETRALSAENAELRS